MGDPNSYQHLIKEWDNTLDKYQKEMDSIQGITEVIEWSAKYLEQDNHWSQDVLTATSFLQIDKDMLENQSKHEIMQSFWDMMESNKQTLHPTTAEPTTDPTNDPTTVE